MVKFSVVIPTWKNLDYLDLCYRGLIAHSSAEHEIIVFFNEIDDKCQEWAHGKKVRWSGAAENLGVCPAVNRAADMATENYICYMNDDMYPLPGWDSALAVHLGLAVKLWLSGTAVEAGKSALCYIGGHDYGRTPKEFDEQRLLCEYATLKRSYNVASTWTPTLLSQRDWNAIGGLDEAYFPGNGSDPDLAMKMYRYGCRHFIGVGTSLCYHFSRTTTARFDHAEWMNPKLYFKKKWGMSRRRFLKSVIQRDMPITPRLLERTARKGA